MDRELDEEVASLAEAELVSAQISDRLRAVECGQVKLSSAHGYSVTGSVVRANPAWVLLKGAEGEELVSIPAIALAQGLQRIAPSPSFMETRMGLTHILRRIMRERTRVRIVAGVHTLVGAIGAVYSDHMDLVGLDTGERWCPCRSNRCLVCALCTCTRRMNSTTYWGRPTSRSSSSLPGRTCDAQRGEACLVTRFSPVGLRFAIESWFRIFLRRCVDG